MSDHDKVLIVGLRNHWMFIFQSSVKQLINICAICLHVEGATVYFSWKTSINIAGRSVQNTAQTDNDVKRFFDKSQSRNFAKA